MLLSRPVPSGYEHHNNKLPGDGASKCQFVLLLGYRDADERDAAVVPSANSGLGPGTDANAQRPHRLHV